MVNIKIIIKIMVIVIQGKIIDNTEAKLTFMEVVIIVIIYVIHMKINLFN